MFEWNGIQYMGGINKHNKGKDLRILQIKSVHMEKAFQRTFITDEELDFHLTTFRNLYPETFKVCKHCGKVFQDFGDAEFCSKQCLLDHLVGTIGVCKNCGKEFKRTETHLKYCSNGCMHQASNKKRKKTKPFGIFERSLPRSKFNP